MGPWMGLSFFKVCCCFLAPFLIHFSSFVDPKIDHFCYSNSHVFFIIFRLPFSPISHPCLKAIGIKSQVRIEKVHFVNLSVSPAREAHFEESELSKIIQKIFGNLSRNPPETTKNNDRKIHPKTYLPINKKPSHIV